MRKTHGQGWEGGKERGREIHISERGRQGDGEGEWSQGTESVRYEGKCCTAEAETAAQLGGPCSLRARELATIHRPCALLLLFGRLVEAAKSLKICQFVSPPVACWPSKKKKENTGKIIS